MESCPWIPRSRLPHTQSRVHHTPSRFYPYDISHSNASCQQEGNRKSSQETTNISTGSTATNPGILGQGQIKLSVSIQESALVIQLHEASGLKSSWKATCSSFVKVQVCPSDDQAVSTKVYENSNCPVYNEAIELPLDSEFQRQRLLISVFHQDVVKQCSELLGSLSFGLRHLISKCRRTSSGVTGWYYILPGNVGHFKHILVHSAESDDDKENQQAVYLQYKLEYKPGGYGLHLRGPHPALHISHLHSGSPAEEAGLRVDDVITRINNKRVKSNDPRVVGELIRHSQNHVIIDVKRMRKPKPASAPPSATKRHQEPASGATSPAKQMKRDADSPAAPTPALGTSQLTNSIQNTFSEQVFNKSCSKTLLNNTEISGTETVVQQKCCNVCSKSKQEACRHSNVNSHPRTPCSGASSCTKWQPDISDIQKAATDVSDFNQNISTATSFYNKYLAGLSPLNTYRDLAVASRDQSECSSLNMAHYSIDFRSGSSDTSGASFSSQSTSSSSGNSSSDQSPSSSSSFSPEQSFLDSPLTSAYELAHATSQRHLTSSSQSTATIATGTSSAENVDATMTSQITLLSADVTVSEISVCSELDINVRMLLSTEQSYIVELQLGVEAFSYPLRYCMPSQQRRAIFQNIEQLLALSRHNLKSVAGTLEPLDSSADIPTAHDVISKYVGSIEILTSSYADYIKGMDHVYRLLREVHQDPEMIQLIQMLTDESGLDVLDVIQTPIVHFEFLRRRFRDIAAYLDVTSPDYQPALVIVKAFQDAAIAIGTL